VWSGGCSPLVQRPLEDESDVAAALGQQRQGTEGARGVEGVRAVGQRDLAPVGRRLLGAHVSAGREGVRGRRRVHVKACLAAQPERHIAAPRATHGALPLLGRLAAAAAGAGPAVVAVHVAAAQVGPGPLVVQHLAAPQAGEGQRVEAHGALGPPSVELLPQRLQVLDGGRAGQPLRRAPQQGGAAQVDERAVRQLLGLRVHLEGAGGKGAG